MTTKVTVNAHAGWPVQVTKINLDDDGNKTSEEVVTVEARTEQDFHIHQHLEIKVKELKPA